MGLREALQSFGSKSKERRELLNQMSEQMRLERLAEERQMSANERELRRFVKEDREESIKEQLEEARKRRKRDIDFGHNPLNAPNVTNSTDWEVLKEKNLFKNKKSSLFDNDGCVLKNNKNLLKTNRRLFGI